MTDEIKKQLEEKGLHQADKYYDIGMVNILKEVDELYGTSGVEAYKNMQRNKYLNKKAELDIDYDLSNLYKNPTSEEELNKIKHIKKLAKANYKQNLASYEKAPNIFKKLWKMLTSKQKALPKQEEQKQEEPIVQQPEEQELVQEPEISKQDLSAQINEVWMDLHKEPGFDIESFIATYNLSEKEAQGFRLKQSQYEKREAFVKKFNEDKKEVGKGAAIENIVNEEIDRQTAQKSEAQNQDGQEMGE